MADAILPTSASDSTPETARKRRKRQPTEAELEQAASAAKAALLRFRSEQREREVNRLGTLAHKAGLAHCDDGWLSEQFAALATLAKTLLLALVFAALLTGCSIDPHVHFDITFQPDPDNPEHTIASVKCWGGARVDRIRICDEIQDALLHPKTSMP